MFNVKVAYIFRPATEPKALSSNSLDYHTILGNLFYVPPENRKWTRLPQLSDQSS